MTVTLKLIANWRVIRRVQYGRFKVQYGNFSFYWGYNSVTFPSKSFLNIIYYAGHLFSHVELVSHKINENVIDLCKNCMNTVEHLHDLLNRLRPWCNVTTNIIIFSHFFLKCYSHYTYSTKHINQMFKNRIFDVIRLIQCNKCLPTKRYIPPWYPFAPRSPIS